MKTEDYEVIAAAGLWPASNLGSGDGKILPPEPEVISCVVFIREFVTPRKTINKEFSSYGMKHRVERWTIPSQNRQSGGYQYISNGAFIEAAHREGYRIARTHPGSLNANFNMSCRRRGGDREATEATAKFAVPCSGCSHSLGHHLYGNGGCMHGMRYDGMPPACDCKEFLPPKNASIRSEMTQAERDATR